jgi:hypothetical protein
MLRPIYYVSETQTSGERRDQYSGLIGPRALTNGTLWHLHGNVKIRASGQPAGPENHRRMPRVLLRLVVRQ